MFGCAPAGEVWQESTAFRELIQNEIHLAREQQRVLLSQGKTGYATIAILLSCIAANVIMFFIHPYYIGLFIAASLYLHMVYFITLIIPVGKGSLRFPANEIQKFFTTVSHTGIIPATDRFTRILLDAFFINSRTLFFGISCLFTFDILFTIIAYSTGMFSLRTAIVILFQVCSFLIFYFLVWRLEPGSIRFREGVNGMKGALATRQYPPWLIGILFSASALLVLLVILTTIILLPGITVKAFVSFSGLKDIGNLFLLIGIIAASQYFIVRFLHGMESAQMAERFSASTLDLLQSARSWDGTRATETDGTTTTRQGSGNDIRGAASVLLQAKIYRLEVNRLLGAFPVYLVNPDFSVIFDEEVLAVITGYLKGAGSACPEQD